MVYFSFFLYYLFYETVWWSRESEFLKNANWQYPLKTKKKKNQHCFCHQCKINHSSVYLKLYLKLYSFTVGALWSNGLCSWLVIWGSWVQIPLGAYALRQGIWSTIVSLNPNVVNGYLAGMYSLSCLWAPIGSSAKAGVIICKCNTQWVYGAVESDITKPSYNKELCSSLFFYPIN